MIHQVLDYQEMSLLSPSCPWHGGNRSGLGSRAVQERPAQGFPSSPSAAPWAGWREEKNPLTGQTTFTVFWFVKCVWKSCLLAGNVFAWVMWAMRVQGAHSRYGLEATTEGDVKGLCWPIFGSARLVLGPQVQSQPVRLCCTLWRWCRTWLGGMKEPCGGAAAELGSHCQQDHTCFCGLPLMLKWTNSFWKRSQWNVCVNR